MVLLKDFKEHLLLSELWRRIDITSEMKMSEEERILEDPK